MCLHFFEKLKYHTSGNKDYSKNMFWAALAVDDNAVDVLGTVSPLAVSRNKALVSSIDEVLKTISI